MKLELKHLAPYSLHRLKGCEHVFTQSPKDTRIFELTAIHPKEKEEFIWDEVNGKASRIDCKPILRPLSDFKGMIVRDIKIELELSHNQVMEFFGFMDGEIKLDNITLGLYNAMCKKYIDFNGLIEKGLAIDINTLKK